MPIYENVTNKFNRGEISPNALARLDVDKVINTCETLTNFLPFRLGGMMYRPGFGYIEDAAGEAYMIPFIASSSDYALLVFTNNALKILVSDAYISSSAVTTPITNGAFTSNITSWTDASGAGSSTAWSAIGGSLALTGAESTSAVSYQTIGSTQTGVEHTMQVVVLLNPVTVMVGTSGSRSNDILEEYLLPGTHNLVFTPAGNITITFINSERFPAHVDSVSFLGTGEVTWTTDIATAGLPGIRFAQSADVIYLARDDGKKPLRIERRGTKSWSVVDFRSVDGPFNTINNTEITLAPSALNGYITLTASVATFASTDVGRLVKISSAGQTVSASVSAEDDGTDSIRVFGVSTGRTFSINITGTWTATVTLQQSPDGVVWSDTTSTYTGNVSTTYNDSFDNSVYYYRLYVKTGDYTSGTVELSLTYAAGSIDGICMINTFSSATSVTASVLQDFGSTSATRDWYLGTWSDTSGYPSALALYEGRLWFAGKSKVWGSVSDAYSSFDTSLEGDSAAIQKTIGFGPVEDSSWLIPSTVLMMGLASSEISIRSTSFGEFLTPDNTNLKATSTQGSADRDAIQIDDKVYYIQRSLTRLYQAEYAADRDTHLSIDLMTLHDEIGIVGIKRIAVSRQPETRIWLVLEDGDMLVLLLDVVEDVKGWSRIQTDGNFEDVTVLPGSEEDQVYVVINRSGSRGIQKLAKVTESRGGSSSKHLDSFKAYTSPGTTITDLGHVNTETVTVWADGANRGTFVVGSNQITVPTAWTDVVVGLPHQADYKSNKVSNYSDKLTLNRRKRVVDIGLVMRNYAPSVISLGPDTASLESMPAMLDGTTAPTTTQTEYDYVPFTFNGDNVADPRIHIRATGPATILALTYTVKQDDKRGDQASDG